MSTVQKAKDFSEFQDVFSHLMRWKLYTAICFCFPLDDDYSHSHIVDVLTKGLETLAIGFPWLAGQAALDKGNGRPGIIPGEQKCPLIVKDLTSDPNMPTMEALRKARYPYSMLDAGVLMPFGDKHGLWDDVPIPVFAIQAGFINGGLILTFLGEHSTMDGAGEGEVLRLFSKACYGDPFTDEELLHGNRPRTDIVPVLDEGAELSPDMNHFHLTRDISGFTSAGLPKHTLGYFYFSPSSLAKLKILASARSSMSENPTVSYTTTNDAVTAFIWKSCTRMRASHLPSDSRSMLVRAVDVRPCLNLPQGYLGNLTHHTYTYLPISASHSTPLGDLASNLRSALNPTALAHGVRSLATVLKTTEDKSKIMYGADLNIDSDIWFSSWAKLACYSLDFNLDLGFPEAVRKPRTESVEGLIHLMPMDREGGILASITLAEKDFEGLREDAEWCEYAEFVG